ncbi:alpha/beta hydrolase [Sediminitomix flava]|uniref:Alpha/beta hydrolase family protein n=1 Tax=Sediminitomix flava TaxID=379075 RepID=A0A315Z5C5_SEDFL|nr:alpha/beta hydrolase fold domain-containing protein [Sediminitomix flava]PWJ38622.1 alpha/beta hydrolase family protein [Sediminitomix flava]
MKKVFLITALIFSSLVLFGQEIHPEKYLYAISKGDSLFVDIYEPSRQERKDITVLVMHGGGFMGGSFRNPRIVEFCETLAKEGFQTASMSYRLTRKDKGFDCDTPKADKIQTFRFAVQDINSCLDYLDTEVGIKRNKIVMLGSSAGAEAVLHAAYGVDAPTVMPQFAGLISLAGAITHIQDITENNAIPSLFFHGTSDKLVPYGSAPHHFCTEDKRGFLILYGSKAITDKLEALDKPFTIYSVANGGHEISWEPMTNNIEQINEWIEKAIIQKENLQQRLEIVKKE